MTCASCGGTCGAKTIETVSNDVLLAEVKARRAKAQQQYMEFYKIHYSGEKRAVMLSGLFALIGVVAIISALVASVYQVAYYRNLLLGLGFVGLLFAFVTMVIGMIKEQNIWELFKQELPESAKMLSRR